MVVKKIVSQVFKLSLFGKGEVKESLCQNLTFQIFVNFTTIYQHWISNLGLLERASGDKKPDVPTLPPNRFIFLESLKFRRAKIFLKSFS